MSKEEVDVVIAGGATQIGALAAACGELDEHVEIKRIGGASAGSIRAAGQAFRIPQPTMRGLIDEVLKDDYLKDRSWNPLHRFGLYKGDNLYKSLQRVFGDKRMGEAKIPLRVVVCDMYTRKPVVIDSQNPEHARLKVVDVLRCSAAIPVFFKAHVLPEWRGNRLFVDGGTAMNFAMNMFDDSDRRTIGIRMAPGAGDDDVRPVRDLASFIEALVALIMWASDNAHISSKKYANVISVPAIGSGLNFALTQKELDARWQAGVDAVKLAKIEGKLN